MPVKKFIKENLVLVAGLALPLLLIISFMAVSIIPKSMTAPPQHKMFFTKEQYINWKKPYTFDIFVKDDKITARVTKQEVSKDYNRQRKETLMVYDGETQNVTKITFSQKGWANFLDDETDIILPETSHITLNTSSKSPDGYTLRVNSHRRRGIISLIGSRRSGKYSLKKGMVRFEVPVQHYRNINFLGWNTSNKERAN